MAPPLYLLRSRERETRYYIIAVLIGISYSALLYPRFTPIFAKLIRLVSLPSQENC